MLTRKTKSSLLNELFDDINDYIFEEDYGSANIVEEFANFVKQTPTIEDITESLEELDSENNCIARYCTDDKLYYVGINDCIEKIENQDFKVKKVETELFEKEEWEEAKRKGYYMG